MKRFVYLSNLLTFYRSNRENEKINRRRFRSPRAFSNRHQWRKRRRKVHYERRPQEPQQTGRSVDRDPRQSLQRLRLDQIPPRRRRGDPQPRRPRRHRRVHRVPPRNRVAPPRRPLHRLPRRRLPNLRGLPRLPPHGRGVPKLGLFENKGHVTLYTFAFVAAMFAAVLYGVLACTSILAHQIAAAKPTNE
ncbi:hypothetical protein Bca52824_082607 [Brassica carinata]|uniref:Uncharacterized protein n=1 Tax=Brassica carinata TaxID=52824 RepID=A0A8X7TUF4_BRACI|nr:hypothetical protein Bca52824_082607 [Brassica carinata]